MPTPRLQTINAWSYSTLNDYNKCPFLLKCKKILRLKEPDNPAFDRGRAIDELAAAYATRRPITVPSANKARGKREVHLLGCPPELERFKEEFAHLRKQKNVMAQQEWAFNRAWEQVDWKDWNHAWLRIKTDLHYIYRKYTCYVIDIKTGKEYPEHKDQQSIYALGALLLYPNITKVVVEHWYLDQGTIGGPQEWSMDQLEDLQLYWMKATKALMTDTLFAPNPGPHCQWCHFRRENGGPCKF